MDQRIAGDTIAAAIAYFILVFAVGFLLGALRTLVVVPRLDNPHGKTVGVLIELPLILAVSWSICRWLTSRFEVAPDVAPRLLMGAFALALLLLAEFLLATAVFGRTVAAQILQYQYAPEMLGLAGQILFSLFPLLQSRR